MKSRSKDLGMKKRDKFKRKSTKESRIRILIHWLCKNWRKTFSQSLNMLVKRNLILVPTKDKMKMLNRILVQASLIGRLKSHMQKYSQEQNFLLIKGNFTSSLLLQKYLNTLWKNLRLLVKRTMRS